VSSATKPRSAEPRVCCLDRPRKYSPGCLGRPPVHDVPVPHNTGDGDPAVVGVVSGRPYDHSDVQVAAVSEPCCAPLRDDQASPEPDTGPLEPAPAGTDEELAAALHRAPEQRGGAHPHEAEPGQPPEHVSAEQALRQHRRIPTNRHIHATGLRKFLGDLQPGVSAADDQHATVRQRLQIPVTRAMNLGHRHVEPAGSRRNERNLERTSSNHYLAGPQVAACTAARRNP
jgi:hypothetical protein